MDEKRPTKEFGKRRPAPLAPPATAPVKRSGHVALMVMGTIAVGSTAFALMPRQACDPAAPGVATPGQPGTACSRTGSSGGSGGGYHWSSRSNFFSSDSASHSSSSGSSESGSGGVTRGGFGSFAHAFGFSGHG